MLQLEYLLKLRKMKRSKAIYALYKGDTFINLGTKEELAKEINVTPKTILFYSGTVWKKRRKENGNSYIVIRVSDKDE